MCCGCTTKEEIRRMIDEGMAKATRQAVLIAQSNSPASRKGGLWRSLWAIIRRFKRPRPLNTHFDFAAHKSRYDKLGT